jgi:hypothetical protein
VRSAAGLLLGCCVFFLSPKAAGALVSLGNYTPWRLMLGRGARVCVAAKSPENLMIVDEEELPLGEWMGMFDFLSIQQRNSGVQVGLLLFVMGRRLFPCWIRVSRKSRRNQLGWE